VLEHHPERRFTLSDHTRPIARKPQNALQRAATEPTSTTDTKTHTATRSAQPDKKCATTLDFHPSRIATTWTFL
jgi:hypothetical protein